MMMLQSSSGLCRCYRCSCLGNFLIPANTLQWFFRNICFESCTIYKKVSQLATANPERALCCSCVSVEKVLSFCEEGPKGAAIATPLVSREPPLRYRVQIFLLVVAKEQLLIVSLLGKSRNARHMPSRWGLDWAGCGLRWLCFVCWRSERIERRCVSPQPLGKMTIARTGLQ